MWEEASLSSLKNDVKRKKTRTPSRSLLAAVDPSASRRFLAPATAAPTATAAATPGLLESAGIAASAATAAAAPVAAAAAALALTPLAARRAEGVHVELAHLREPSAAAALLLLLLLSLKRLAAHAVEEVVLDVRLHRRHRGHLLPEELLLAELLEPGFEVEILGGHRHARREEAVAADRGRGRGRAPRARRGDRGTAAAAAAALARRGRRAAATAGNAGLLRHARGLTLGNDAAPAAADGGEEARGLRLGRRGCGRGLGRRRAGGLLPLRRRRLLTVGLQRRRGGRGGAVPRIRRRRRGGARRLLLLLPLLRRRLLLLRGGLLLRRRLAILRRWLLVLLLLLGRLHVLLLLRHLKGGGEGASARRESNQDSFLGNSSLDRRSAGASRREGCLGSRRAWAPTPPANGPGEAFARRARYGAAVEGGATRRFRGGGREIVPAAAGAGPPAGAPRLARAGRAKSGCP